MSQNNGSQAAPQDVVRQHIRIDLRDAEMVHVSAASRNVVALWSNQVGGRQLSNSFAEHEHLSGSLDAASVILIFRGVYPYALPLAGPSVTDLVTRQDNLVMAIAPEPSRDLGDDVVWVLWRRAFLAMNVRGCGVQISVHDQDTLALRTDPALPAGTVRLTADPEQIARLPRSIVADLAHFATSASVALH